MEKVQSALRWSYGYTDPKTGERQPPGNPPELPNSYVPWIAKALARPQERWEALETLPKKHLMALVEFIGTRAVVLGQDAARSPDEWNWRALQGAMIEMEKMQRFFMLLLDMKEADDNE